MTVNLNHTIVAAHDKHASARFLADILGLEVSPDYGPFVPVAVPNGVTLDFMDTPGSIPPQHYASVVSEEAFDEISPRARAAGLSYWAAPSPSRPGEVTTNDGGRGPSSDAPNAHRLEILTRPYGSGG